MAAGYRERPEEDEERAPRSMKRSGPYSNYENVKQNRKDRSEIRRIHCLMPPTWSIDSGSSPNVMTQPRRYLDTSRLERRSCHQDEYPTRTRLFLSATSALRLSCVDSSKTSPDLDSGVTMTKTNNRLHRDHHSMCQEAKLSHAVGNLEPQVLRSALNEQ